ncbi:CesT family type III secretion system chaperone [Pseudomonas typographi]|uniref:CesT family type III secretion system chaperone n=1 Tax=Pseudomonas typographi TaxID=2715964 RepID=UPI00168656D3|nr:hypothetical protein [Pseudomonas typographi]
MSPKKFHETVAPLLKYLNVASEGSGLEDTYELEFKDITVQITGVLKERLLLVARLGELRSDEENSLLWQLLQQNIFADDFPALQISAVADSKSIILWAQEWLGELEASALINLFERFCDRARGIQQWLEQPVATRAINTPHKPASSINNLEEKLVRQSRDKVSNTPPPRQRAVEPANPSATASHPRN